MGLPQPLNFIESGAERVNFIESGAESSCASVYSSPHTCNTQHSPSGRGHIVRFTHSCCCRRCIDCVFLACHEVNTR